MQFYNTFYKKRSDYPFGFLSQREWDELDEGQKKSTSWKVFEMLPKNQQELVMWYKNIYEPNRYEVAGNMAKFSNTINYRKEWEDGDHERRSRLVKEMNEKLFSIKEINYQLLVYMPSWQKTFSQNEN